ncbi:MAG: glycerol kinase [Planctomycetota bacterium]|jgi:glycerol kinase
MTRLLAIDAGTTGVTSILFNAELEPVARAYREFRQHFPRPGWVEHEAHEILAAVDATVKEACDGVSSIDAIGITNQRETVFAYDTIRKRAIGRGIVWQDRRTADRCEELRNSGEQARVRQHTGLVLDPYFSATKMEWMLREDPAVETAAREGSLRFLTVDALIVDHLTRGEVLATDRTNASRTMLFDIEKRVWSPEMCELFGVPIESLPEVRESTAAFGLARLAGGLEAPIHGIAGDQQAALFGQGCFEAGSLKNTYGTGCFLLLNAGDERKDIDGLLTTLAVGRDGRSVYAIEGSVFAAGLVVQWLRDQLGLIENAADSEVLARSVDSTEGVVCVPAFTGLGAPYWDANARAALMGMTRGTGKAHIVRAALDSIAFQCTELIELLRKETGLKLERLRVDGGASANGYLMQRQADLAKLAIERPVEVEATARGAASLAGLGVGIWPDPGDVSVGRSGRMRYVASLDEERRTAELAGWRAAVARVRTN